MEHKVINEGDITIVILSGRMDAQAANEAEITCNKLIDEGKKMFIFDLADLDYISSAGLRVLLAVTKKLKTVEGVVKIAGVKNYVKEVFDITGFTPIFEIFDSKDEAVKTF